MDVVIRDAKTIEEFKNRRADMGQRARTGGTVNRPAHCTPGMVRLSWSTPPGGGGTTGIRAAE